MGLYGNTVRDLRNDWESGIFQSGGNTGGGSGSGIAGARGPRGPAGPKGTAGADGADGAIGPKGADGADATAIDPYTKAEVDAKIPDITGLLKQDGSLDMDTGYTPSNDLSVATKKFVDDITNTTPSSVASIAELTALVDPKNGETTLAIDQYGRSTEYMFVTASSITYGIPDAGATGKWVRTKPIMYRELVARGATVKPQFWEMPWDEELVIDQVEVSISGISQRPVSAFDVHNGQIKNIETAQVDPNDFIKITINSRFFTAIETKIVSS